MPKHVKARAAQDEREARTVSKLAKSHHAPADWKMHAQMVIESWAGKTPTAIAAEFGCHPQTVRVHVARFNEQGVEGLGMRPGSGRKPRLSEQERSRILALVKQPPPGRLERYADDLAARDEHGSAQWSLDALTKAAHAQGIHVQRSQIRRIFLREGKRWRRPHSWATSTDKDFARNPNNGRHPLHSTAQGVDDHLHRRVGTSSPANLSASAWLGSRGPSHQSPSGLLQGTRESMGVWGIAGSRWQSDYPVCGFTQLQGLYCLA
jgi:transposase